jgi:2-amino-4-hydroxy-6-hydroxymethyldihydropteridine diphosphokinase
LNNAAIALGSNVGDRESHLAYAVARLRDILSDVRVSRWYDTAPVGVVRQSNFLNGALTGSTALSARELLTHLLNIERERGRERPYAGSPRTLDLDLVLFGGEVIDEPGLHVPHPRFRERPFVLEPLAEIAADWIDPETGTPVGTLLSQLRDRRS